MNEAKTSGGNVAVSLPEVRWVTESLISWLNETWADWPPLADRVILGLNAYVLNKGNVTPGFLRGLAADVAALAVHAHPQ